MVARNAPFPCRFSHCLRRNGAENMFKHHQDVPSRPFRDNINRFSCLRLKHICLRAQRINYAPFVKVARFFFSAFFGNTSGLDSSSGMFARRHGVPLDSYRYRVNVLLSLMENSVVHLHRKGSMWSDF